MILFIAGLCIGCALGVVIVLLFREDDDDISKGRPA